jgi:hypothetical protein
MKTNFTLFLIFSLLFGSQVMAQTYGLFTENPDWKTKGSLGSGDTPNGGWTTSGDIQVEVVGDVYKGAEALKVTLKGSKQGRLYFTYNVKDAMGSSDNNRFVPREDWNDDYAFLVFYLKLLTKTDFRLEIRANRDGGVIADADESMVKHGVDTTLIGKWQKIILPLKHGPNEWDGKQMSYEEWATFTIRDRTNIGSFIIDEMYVDYRPKTTFGLFTDVAENMLSGSLKTDKRTPKGGIVDDGALSEVITGNAYGGTEALKVTMAGKGGGRTSLAYDVSDWSGAKGSANFTEWNDENTLLVLHTKLITPMDYRVAWSSFRPESNKIDECDESIKAQHGMNSADLEKWQKIVVPIRPGLEGKIQDNSKWSAFTLRDRDNKGDFLIDEVYIIYPEGNSTGFNNIKTETDFKIKSYPNPAHGNVTIEFTLPDYTYTTINIYNQIGIKISSLINSNLQAGTHNTSFDTSNLPAGLYFYELKSDKGSQKSKMMIY